ncbi:hypothetical protein APUTEX25_005600, partial [Auxenochlorella protothecoides]
AALPNLTLKLYPLSKAQQAIYETTGTVKELVFRTTPKANKAEIKEHLEKVYGLSVEKVNTCNYLGRKKHGKAGFYSPATGMSPPPPAGGGAVFVSYSERREHVSNKGGRKTGGHVYQIKFFLVDATGLEHLAAVGEDQGDAHYIYSNQPGFPGLYGHNKQDVKRWLEDVMAASQLRAGYHLDLVQDEVPTDPSSIRLPTFVAYRHERTELDDGRHAMCWFLVDVFGKEHIAISGEEKETRDGHYDYSTQGVFHVVAPLSCHNQAAAALAAAPASPLAGPEVAALASWILQAWASALGCHLAVLTQERYVRDPGAELEAALGGRRAWLDAAAAAVTHRRVGQGAQEARAGREPAGGGDKGVGDGTAEGKGGDSAAVAETAAAETAAAETEPENEEGSGSEGEAMDAEEAAE